MSLQIGGFLEENKRDLTQEIADELLRLIDDGNDAHIVERCLEEGVL